MKDFYRFFFLNFIPSSKDAGLLVLRVAFGAYMLIAHGWPKLMAFSEKSKGFPDPFHIGSTYSFSMSLAFEVLGCLCLILGLFTRFASLAGIVNMSVAFFLVHKAVFTGRVNGELAFLYLAAFAVLFLSGGGRYSLDSKMGAKS